MNTTNHNPYVGLRPFRKEEGHLFFGRDRETRDLTALVATERLVLFYAQSGAGKSSLVNTRLIPDLESNRYEVFPVGRVSGDVPAGLEISNVYVFNLIRSLIQHEADPADFAKLSLTQFMVQLNKDDNGYFHDKTIPVGENNAYPPGRRALIVDQFEEIFTSHLQAWKLRADFFRQLAKAMQDDQGLWVVLTMREDYIASLDPHSHLLPGRLRVRYYMQRLEGEAAVSAVKGPAAQNGRPYADNVAEKLVDDLSRNQVKTPEGGLEYVQGQYVEPIVLQVVCHGLWKNLPPGDQITKKELDELGDVNQSLENYYDEQIKLVADHHSVPEREIREWFEQELITVGNTRNMVLSDTIKSQGLRDVIRPLQGSLIRAEVRAGQVWYELSHDRLIEPVRNSNKEWFEQHLNLFQRQATLWVQQGRNEGSLLRGVALEKAEQEAETLPKLNDDEHAFLAACRALRVREQRESNQRRLIRISFITTAILLVLVVVGGLFTITTLQAGRDQAVRLQMEAENARVAAQEAQVDAQNAALDAVRAQQAAEEAKVQAEEQAKIALAGSLAAQAESVKSTDHALALLLGVEAYRSRQNLLTRTALFQLLQYTPYKREFGFAGAVSSVAISPDGSLIAAASCRPNANNQCPRQGESQLGNIVLYDAQLQKLREVPGDYGAIYSLAFRAYPDRLVLAAGGCDPDGCSETVGQVTLWQIEVDDSWDDNITPLRQISNHGALVKTIAFGPETAQVPLLATGSYDTTILLWNVSDPANPRRVGGTLDHDSFVNGVAFSPDGSALISAGDDKTVYLWDLQNLETIPAATRLSEQQHRGPVEAVTFSLQGLKDGLIDCPDGSLLATAGDDNLIYLWDWCPDARTLKPHQFESGKSFAMTGHTGYVKSVSFSADGEYLASAGLDNQVLIWDMATGEQVGAPLSAHTNAVNAVAFGSSGNDKPYFVTVSNDRTVIRWDFATFNPLSERSIIPIDSENLTQIQNGEPVALTADLQLKFFIDDQTVVLKDLQDEDYLSLPNSDSLINGLWVDGVDFITRDLNGYYVRWNMNPADWVQKACEAARRNLTPEEWQQYFQDTDRQKTCVEYP